MAEPKATCPKKDEYDLELFHKEAVNIAKIAGKIVHEAFDKEKTIDTKACVTDLVTETDQEVERVIIQLFKEKFPSHSFIGEESVAAGQNCNLTDNPTWIIDPIDGTTNFVHRFPFVAISIGLAINKEVVIGVIYNCILDEMYSAIIGHGATCNGKPIKVSGQTEISKALLVAEIGAGRRKEKIDNMMYNLRTVITEPYMAHSVRSLGSAALNMCYIAAGRADGYYESGIHCWDIAAGIVILEEAGGTCLSPSGGPVDLMARQLVCGGSEALTRHICSIVTPTSYPRD